MRAARVLLAVAVVSVFGHLCHAARWVGPFSVTGPVARPQSYLDVVAPLVRDTFQFDDLSPGAILNFVDLGGYVFSTRPTPSWVVATVGPVAESEPASPPMALLIQGGTTPTTLSLVMAEPVISVGFALMGFEPAARLRVYGEGESLLGDYSIPAGFPHARRWVGLSEDDRDIWRVELEPLAAGDYGLDDLEIGVHAPEPHPLALWGVGTMVLVRGGQGSRRRPRAGRGTGLTARRGGG